MPETPSILRYSEPDTQVGVGRRSRLCTIALLLCIPCVFIVASDVLWRPLVSHLETLMSVDDARVKAWKILVMPAAMNFLICILAAIRCWRLRYRGTGLAIAGALICVIAIAVTAQNLNDTIHPRFHTA